MRKVSAAENELGDWEQQAVDQTAIGGNGLVKNRMKTMEHAVKFDRAEETKKGENDETG